MLCCAAAAALFGAPSADARSRSKPPRITSVRCWPIQICTDMHTVAPGGRLRFRGHNLRKRGMIVVFPRKARSAAGGGKRAALTARLRHRSTAGFVATVPATARSGRIRIYGPHGARSNVVGPIHVVKRQTFSAPRGTGTAFDGTGMWIWYVSKSGGSAPAIAAQAQQYGVKTVFVKSSDGTSWWDQFSPDLVAGLKAAGIHVCAWQFVYGRSATAEASLGARAAQTGADCLVIDAEGQYEGLYSQAQTYIQNLRSLIGQDYPLGLAGFPYVDYHPSFPYSVFLGPGGAQYNAPQVYWKAIGTSVDTALAHTYLWNSVYERPIFPLGQLYDNPSTADISRFRSLSTGYGASGVSWWSWQSASSAGWGAIAPPDPAPIVPAPAGYPLLKSGSKGDVVAWAQQHLIAAGQAVSASGTYDSATVGAVSSFQSSHFLPVTGQIDAATWQALLQLEPAPVAWNARKARSSARSAGAGRRNGPRSAFIRTRHYEIPRTPPGP